MKNLQISQVMTIITLVFQKKSGQCGLLLSTKEDKTPIFFLRSNRV